MSQLGSPPRALDNYASYDCRGRNRVAGARISEHGLANAIDIRGVHLANGRFAEFTDRKLDREFREAVRKMLPKNFLNQRRRVNNHSVAYDAANPWVKNTRGN